ncbi:cytochrome P450 [Fomitopsis serialis]|uniref:cytochrome P450 n=1 Tax=Fomitopsis serialis TaxID=139415 RepID=UPI0020077409|nr:cytochrome P450 [Neoantrodia serialis]KAH9916801.1 cytochrome P450 [Neoantrodia serialis]
MDGPGRSNTVLGETCYSLPILRPCNIYSDPATATPVQPTPGSYPGYSWERVYCFLIICNTPGFAEPWTRPSAQLAYGPFTDVPTVVEEAVPKWQQELAGRSSMPAVNVSPWFSRLTLDAICEAGFDFNCGALDDDLNEYVSVYKDMFRDSMVHPTPESLLFRHFWPYMPESMLRTLVRLPAKQFVRMRHSLSTINRLSERLIKQRKTAAKTQTGDQDGERGRDLMSILVRANMSENPKHRLTDTEMIAQVATLLLAGHETSAGTLNWLFWELAKDVDYQQKIREEVAAARADVVAREIPSSLSRIWSLWCTSTQLSRKSCACIR